MNDILFCSTVDAAQARKFVNGLERQTISYLQRWEEIPVFRRKKYGNAKEICNIYINRGQLEMAEQFYETLSDEEKTGIILKKEKE